MSRRYVSTNSADAGDGAMIWILAVIVGLALVATFGSALIAGGSSRCEVSPGCTPRMPATGAPVPH